MLIEIIVAWIVVVLFLFITIFQFISYHIRYKKNIAKNNNQVRVQPLFINIALAWLILIDFLLLDCAIKPPTDLIAHLIIFGGIIGLCSALVYIGFTNLHIEIQKTGFVYRNYLGIKKFYAYKDIYYKINRGTESIYQNNKKVVCFYIFWDFNYDIILRLIKKHSEKQEMSYTH